MTRTHDPCFRWASAVAVLLVPLGASAQQSNQAREPGSAQAQDRGARSQSVTRVETAFTRTMPGGCTYASSVTGTVRTVGPAQDREGRGERSFAPNLQLRVSVRCPGAGSQQETTVPVRADAVTARELEALLASRGQIAQVVGGRQCVYAPRFRVDDGRLQQETVSSSCAGGAYGGGPRSADDDAGASSEDVGGSFGIHGTHPGAATGGWLPVPSNGFSRPARGGGPRSEAPAPAPSAEPAPTPVHTHGDYDQDRAGRGLRDGLTQ